MAFFFCGINWLVGLEFNGPLNTIRVISSWSVYLTTLFLGRCSPLSSKTVLVHIVLRDTNNCPSWISKRERMTRKYFMINLHKRMLPSQAVIKPMTSWSPVRHAFDSHGGWLLWHCLHLESWYTIFKLNIQTPTSSYLLENLNKSIWLSGDISKMWRNCKQYRPCSNCCSLIWVYAACSCLSVWIFRVNIINCMMTKLHTLVGAFWSGHATGFSKPRLVYFWAYKQGMLFMPLDRLSPDITQLFINRVWNPKSENLGPVLQSVVSLTSSLRVISLTVLADSMYNILIFFAEKMWVAFAHIFSAKNFSIFAYHSL